MIRWRDGLRKGVPPPVLLFLFLLFDVWSNWPALIHPEQLLILSWRTCAAVVIGGVSLCLALSGLFMLISRKTTLNALFPERTRVLVTEGCYRYSRNPVYLGFVGLHIAAALLLDSVIGILATPVLVTLLTLLHIQVEEAGMRQRFSLQWQQYCDKTPRWLSGKSLFRRLS